MATACDLTEDVIARLENVRRGYRLRGSYVHDVDHRGGCICHRQLFCNCGEHAGRLTAATMRNIDTQAKKTFPGETFNAFGRKTSLAIDGCAFRRDYGVNDALEGIQEFVLRLNAIRMQHVVPPRPDPNAQYSEVFQIRRRDRGRNCVSARETL